MIDDDTNEPRCPAGQMEVFEVTYTDCSEPWTLCRCRNAPVSKEDMITEFGRLPPMLRGTVRHFMHFDGAGWAYSSNSNLVTFGDVVNPTVMLHEAGHSLDAGKLHIEEEYVSAVEKDTCWPDYYAADADNADFSELNLTEPWAQALVVRRYEVQIGKLPKDASCLRGALDAVGAQTDEYLDSPKCLLADRPKSSELVAYEAEEDDDEDEEEQDEDEVNTVTTTEYSTGADISTTPTTSHASEASVITETVEVPVTKSTAEPVATYLMDSAAATLPRSYLQLGFTLVAVMVGLA